MISTTSKNSKEYAADYFEWTIPSGRYRITVATAETWWLYTIETGLPRLFGPKDGAILILCE